MNIDRLNQFTGYLGSLKRFEMHHLMLKKNKVNQRVTDLVAIGELQSFNGYSVKAATVDSWEEKTHVILLTIELFF
jgi:hypothetical protein